MKVVRSSSATIRIPKLGVSIRPRISAESFITNIEGVLDRVQQVLEGIIPSLPPKRKSRANKVLMNLKKARQGKLSFFLELIDPSGRSGIAGSDMTKIKRRPLSKKELEKLEDSQ
jgi:zinc finger protein